MARLLAVSLPLLLGLILMGCKEDPPPAAAEGAEPPKAAAPEAAPPAAPAEATKVDPAAARAEAQEIWSDGCAECHGESGKADTEMAEMLEPIPRSFADAAWQQEATDEQIAKVIVGGGEAGGKSDSMPSHPELEGKTEVVDALVEMIRSFAPDS